MTAVAGRAGGRGSQILRSPAVKLVVKRLLLAIPIVLGVTILTFWVINLIPGDPARQILGAEATDQQVHAMRIQMGLNRPAYARYLTWLGHAVRGDLGRSPISGQPVGAEITGRLAVTGELLLVTFVATLVLAIGLALLAAGRPNGFFDRLSQLISVIGLSAANYVLALVLVLVFSVRLGWLPAIGFVPPSKGLGANLESLILPATSLGFSLFAIYTRFLRGDLVDQMQGEEYITVAQAKGISPGRVLLRHAFRNSSYGLIAVVGLNVGTIIGVTVIIEQIFALPGIGQLLLQAINTRDVVTLQACVVVFAVAVVVANLVADLLQTVLDPRLRYGDG